MTLDSKEKLETEDSQEKRVNMDGKPSHFVVIVVIIQHNILLNIIISK